MLVERLSQKGRHAPVSTFVIAAQAAILGRWFSPARQ
jgi:hypothetical protein